MRLNLEALLILDALDRHGSFAAAAAAPLGAGAGAGAAGRAGRAAGAGRRARRARFQPREPIAAERHADAERLHQPLAVPAFRRGLVAGQHAVPQHVGRDGAAVLSIGGLDISARLVVVLLRGALDDRATALATEARDRPEVRRAVRRGPLLQLPGRECLLFATSSAELADPTWPGRAGIGVMDAAPEIGPQIIWPAGREWVVASEIDWDSTIVAGMRLHHSMITPEAMRVVSLDLHLGAAGAASAGTEPTDDGGTIGTAVVSTDGPSVEEIAERTAAIEGGMEQAQEAQKQAEAAKAQYEAQLSSARDEAAKIREDARSQGAQIVADMREQANAEATRIVDSAKKQTEADRQAAAVSLRSDVGRLSTDLASKIVGESLHDEARQKGIVDRFLAELEAGKIRPESATAASEAAASSAGSTRVEA